MLNGGGQMGSFEAATKPQVAPYGVSPYNDEHLTLDFTKQAVALDAERMILTRKEYDLLALLVQHAGEIIPRNALLMQVWGYGADIRTRTFDVHVRLLRKKLGGYADQYIETVFGIGYRFQPFHAPRFLRPQVVQPAIADRKSTRLNSSHLGIS